MLSYDLEFSADSPGPWLRSRSQLAVGKQVRLIEGRPEDGLLLQRTWRFRDTCTRWAKFLGQSSRGSRLKAQAVAR